MKISQGAKFRQTLKDNNPLQIVGAINAYCAMLAQDAGHKAIYLSGGGVANASYGLPDLGITSLNDVSPMSNASAMQARSPCWLTSTQAGAALSTLHARLRQWKKPAPLRCI